MTVKELATMATAADANTAGPASLGMDVHLVCISQRDAARAAAIASARRA